MNFKTLVKSSWASTLLAASLATCTLSSLFGEWSTPVIVSPPGNQYPSVIIDEQSNAVVSWLSADDLTHYSTSLPVGSTIWSYPPLELAQTSSPQYFSGLILHTDHCGNKAASWLGFDSSNPFSSLRNLQVSRLNSKDTSWTSTPLKMNLLFASDDTNVNIVADELGNLIAGWVSPESAAAPTMAYFSVLAAEDTQWSMPFSSTPYSQTTTLTAPGVAVNNGRAIAVWKARLPELGLQWAMYDFCNRQWSQLHTQILSSSIEDIDGITVCMDSMGNATALFLGIASGKNNTLYASTLKSTDTSWSNVERISNSLSNVCIKCGISAHISANMAGDVTALWIEQDPSASNLQIVKSAHLPSQGSWTLPITVSGAYSWIGHFKASSDAYGNMLAIWEASGLTGEQLIQISDKAYNGSWSSSPRILSYTGTRPHIKLNNHGLAIAVWQDTNQSEIMASTYSGIFSKPVPISPSLLIGKIKKYEFLNQQKYVLCMYWDANSSDDVTAYKIYENGQLLSTIAANNFLEFEKLIPSKYIDSKYTITATNKFGFESTHRELQVIN